MRPQWQIVEPTSEEPASEEPTEEQEQKLETWTKQHRLEHLVPGIKGNCLDALAGCWAKVTSKSNGRIIKQWVSSPGCPHIRPTRFPQSWKDDAITRAIDASRAMCYLRDLERQLQRGFAESAVFTAMLLGEVLTKSGFRADERLAKIERQKIKKLRAPNAAKKLANRPAILELYGKLPAGMKKTSKVEKIAKALTLHRGTVWKYLRDI
jgi:hypothetical protein